MDGIRIVAFGDRFVEKLTDKGEMDGVAMMLCETEVCLLGRDEKVREGWRTFEGESEGGLRGWQSPREESKIGEVVEEEGRFEASCRAGLQVAGCRLQPREAGERRGPGATTTPQLRIVLIHGGKYSSM